MPRNYLEAIPEMSDSDLMAWAAESRYDDGAEPDAVRWELVEERGYSEDDIEAEYDRLLAHRAASHRAAREEMELSHGEVW